MTPSDPFITRHGYKPKRSSVGPFVFLVAIGICIAAASIAGTRYFQPEARAPRAVTPQETDTPAITEVTAAEAPPAETVTAAEPVPAPSASAAPPPPPKAVAPARKRAAPEKVKEADPEPKPEPTTDPFSTTQ